MTPTKPKRVRKPKRLEGLLIGAEFDPEIQNGRVFIDGIHQSIQVEGKDVHRLAEWLTRASEYLKQKEAKDD